MDVLAEFEDYLPTSFRTLETRQLLTGVVDLLMSLVTSYPLSEQKDPALYLDSMNPNWMKDFPIPIDEANARSLVNDWLRDAVRTRKERQELLAQAREFTCQHSMYFQLPDWSIETTVFLPNKITVALDTLRITSTRFEMLFYEGEHLLARGGAVFGKLENGKVEIPIYKCEVKLKRHFRSEPITIRFFENGQLVYSEYIEGSDVDDSTSILIFTGGPERWQLNAMSTCAVKADHALVRLPFDSTPFPSLDVIGTDHDKGIWTKIYVDTSIQVGDEKYIIKVNQPWVESDMPRLVGRVSSYVSSPSITYLGWPNLRFPDDSQYECDGIREYANGEPVQVLKRNGFVGIVNYVLRDSKGITLLRRRFGVLPESFLINSTPNLGSSPAKVVVRSISSTACQLVSKDLSVTQGSSDHSAIFELQSSSDTPPAQFLLEIGSIRAKNIILSIPFPYEGVRVFDADRNPIKKRDISMQELLGCYLVLMSANSYGEDFFVELDLVCQVRPHPKKSYRINTGIKPETVMLFSYYADILQMLSCTQEQDAYVKLEVTTSRSLLRLNIRRYIGSIQWEPGQRFSIRDINNELILEGANAHSMRISSPQESPIDLDTTVGQWREVGVFDIPSALRIEKEPWMIYPAKKSPIQFRPAIFVNKELVDSNLYDLEVSTLHKAAKAFHPTRNPLVIQKSVLQMSMDFRDSGWQYLADLKQQYSHLKLSSFESWKALALNQRALAAAVFILALDVDFCERIRDELAVLWAALPLQLWSEVYQESIEVMKSAGVPEISLKSFSENREITLKAVIPGFEFVGHYLRTGNTSKIRAVPPEIVLPSWYQKQRQVHDSEWPMHLNSELSLWIESQSLPTSIKQLAQIDDHISVTFLPIFIAYVTVGKATLNDLGVALPYLKFCIRQISEFDRVNWFDPVHALMVAYLISLN